MFRELRRKNRQMTKEEAYEILDREQYGTLSTVDKDNNPYGVPLSYAVIDGDIYFHCALEGYKLDNIKHNNNVVFSVVGGDDPTYQEHNFTTIYESVVAFGKAEIVENKEDQIAALKVLCEKYLPEFMNHFEEDISLSLPACLVVKINVEHITGKSNKSG